MAGTGIIALILAQLTGNLVLADEAGRFSYGAASSMGFVVTAMFMMIDMGSLTSSVSCRHST